MLSEVEPSRAGSLADLEVALEGADTQSLPLLAQWVPVVSAMVLQHQEDSVEAVEEDSEEDLMVAEEEADSVEVGVSKTEEVMVVVGEEVLVSVAEADLEEEIVVGMEAAPTVPPLPTLQPDQAAVEVDLEAVHSEGVNLQTAMAQGLVGMTHVVAVAHLMIETAVIVAAATEVMVIAMVRLEVEVEATWSR